MERADLPPEEREFIDRLEHLTARVGRGIFVAFPGAFFIGLLLLPLGLPAGLALTIVVLGVIGLSIAFERLYRGETRGPRAAPGRPFLRTTTGRIAIGFGVVTLIYVIFVASVSGRA